MSINQMLCWCGCIVCGFFLGSVMFGSLLPKWFMHKDICALSDDGNPGSANVFVHCGVPMGLLCLFLDLLKGYLPVAFAMNFLDDESLWFSAVMCAPVLGHAIAPLHHFHGGKCIATAFGVLAGLLPKSYAVFLLAILYISFSTFVKIKSHRVRSITVFALFGGLSAGICTVKGLYAVAVGCLLVSLVVIVKHTKYFAQRNVKETAFEPERN